MFLLVALERFGKGLEGPCYSEDPGSEDLGPDAGKIEGKRRRE